MDGDVGTRAGVRVRRSIALEWGEVEAYVEYANARKGLSSYPFDEMEAGGKVLVVRGRTLGSVRGAIKRYGRMERGKNSRWRRRYAARLARDERGEFVKVWRLS